MKVLQVNKFNHLVGGADKYFLDLAELLPLRGVETAKFCMAHPDNLPDKYAQYFASQADFNDYNIIGGLKNAGRMIYSREAARRFEKVVKVFRPDRVHLHNIYHQLSPSLLPTAKKYGLPVVMHLHDYKYLCPNYKLYNARGVCERCRGGKYYNCARYKCLKDSRSKSALAALEMYIHHRLLRIYEKNVDLFIAPSEFMKNKYLEWGGDPAKITVVPYFIKTDEYEPKFTPGDYFLYYGRLSGEKGVGTLLKAFKCLIKNRPEAKLKIIGKGPEFGNLKLEIGNLGLADSVKLLGAKYGEELRQIVAGSLAVIVPSEWYEVSGIVIMEANALGKPVVGANIGGIGENIADNETGMLFTPGQAGELANKMKILMNNPALAEILGKQGRERVVGRNSPKKHLDKIIEIYQMQIQNSKH